MKTLFLRVGMICAMLNVLACSEPADREPITETSERSTYRFPIKPNATSDERFLSPDQLKEKKAAELAAANGNVRNTSPYHFDVPQGWALIAPTQFRNPNFKVGSSDKIQCYMTTLSGDGGGIASNVNRWYAQLGLEPLSEEEIEALTSVKVMGYPARIVNISGKFKGMGSETETDVNYRLLGAVIQAPDSLITIKMTGPESDTLPELSNFAGFVDSLHSGEGHSHGDEDGQAHGPGDGHGHGPGDGHNHPPTAPPLSGDEKMPADHPPIGGAQKPMPADHPPIPSADSSTSSEDPASGGGYVWDVPEGWTKSDTGSSMRLITLSMTMEDQEPGECYIVILPGAAGGRLGNYNRWLAQLGNTPITEADLGEFPTVKMFDQDIPVLSCEGSYRGMSGGEKAGYMLLGTSVEHEGQSIFVKLIGPKAVVLANQKQFEAFCTSLKVKS